MIARAGFDAYSALIDRQGQEAMRKIREFSSKLKWGNTKESRAFARELLHDYAYDVITSYGDNAASIAAEYYDELARLAGADVPRAIMAGGYTAEQVSGAVDYATRSVWDADEDGLKPVSQPSIDAAVAGMVQGRVMRMANQTMWDNASRDHARYARVTRSAHPCAFCLMLASAGFVYTSEKTAVLAHGLHSYHDSCSCVAVASFDEDGLEGYQDTVDGYYDMWRTASESLPDSATRESWNELTAGEQEKYRRPDHPTWNPYANYRTHQVLSQMRSLYGIEK